MMVSKKLGSTGSLGVHGRGSIVECQLQQELAQFTRALARGKFAPLFPAIDPVNEPGEQPVACVIVGERHRPEHTGERDIAADLDAHQLNTGTIRGWFADNAVKADRTKTLPALRECARALAWSHLDQRPSFPFSHFCLGIVADQTISGAR